MEKPQSVFNFNWPKRPAVEDHTTEEVVEKVKAIVTTVLENTTLKPDNSELSSSNPTLGMGSSFNLTESGSSNGTMTDLSTATNNTILSEAFDSNASSVRSITSTTTESLIEIATSASNNSIDTGRDFTIKEFIENVTSSDFSVGATSTESSSFTSNEIVNSTKDALGDVITSTEMAINSTMKSFSETVKSEISSVTSSITLSENSTGELSTDIPEVVKNVSNSTTENIFSAITNTTTDVYNSAHEHMDHAETQSSPVYVILGVVLAVLVILIVVLILVIKKYKSKGFSKSGEYCVTQLKSVSVSSENNSSPTPNQISERL